MSNRFAQFNDRELFVLANVLRRVSGISLPRQTCDSLYEELAEYIVHISDYQYKHDDVNFDVITHARAKAGYNIEGSLEFVQNQKSFYEFTFN